MLTMSKSSVALCLALLLVPAASHADTRADAIRRALAGVRYTAPARARRTPRPAPKVAGKDACDRHFPALVRRWWSGDAAGLAAWIRDGSHGLWGRLRAAELLLDLEPASGPLYLALACPVIASAEAPIDLEVLLQPAACYGDCTDCPRACGGDRRCLAAVSGTAALKRLTHGGSRPAMRCYVQALLRGDGAIGEILGEMVPGILGAKPALLLDEVGRVAGTAHVRGPNAAEGDLVWGLSNGEPRRRMREQIRKLGALKGLTRRAAAVRMRLIAALKQKLADAPE